MNISYDKDFFSNGLSTIGSHLIRNYMSLLYQINLRLLRDINHMESQVDTTPLPCLNNKPHSSPSLRMGFSSIQADLGEILSISGTILVFYLIALIKPSFCVARTANCALSCPQCDRRNLFISKFRNLGN